MNNFNFRYGFEQAWANIVTFTPRVLLFIAIIVAGYFISKLLCKGLNAILERIGFDRWVERGGIKRALSRSNYDASDLLAKVLFYASFLFVLQFAFGVFGPNPISDLLTRVVAYLPNVFFAMIIIVVASAVAAGVRDILRSAMGGLSYGRGLANLAAALIVAVGIFAALNELNIAPAIVTGLFYAGLALIVGSGIIAIGGSGIVPLRRKWEEVLARAEQEAPRIKAELGKLPSTTEAKAGEWAAQAERAAASANQPAEPRSKRLSQEG